MINLATQGLLPLAFWSPGPGEMLLLAVIALLLYGGDLPQVARSWGKTFAEFRRGLHGIQNDINEAVYSEPERIEYRADIDETYVDPDYPESDDIADATVREAEASEVEPTKSDSLPRD